MKPQFEKLNSGESSFLIFERNDVEFPFYWHYHPEYELTLIVDSSGQRFIGDSIADYGPGDLVLLGPNLPHSWRSDFATGIRRHRAVVAQFREDFLGRHFFNLKEMEPVSRLLRRASNGVSFSHTDMGGKVACDMEKLLSLSPSQRLVALLSSLVELATVEEAQSLSSLQIRPICRPTEQQRIDAICRYLHEHFRRQIHYPELAARFHMDQSSLCRFFRRATGRTITDYLNELRVAAAAHLLITTGDSMLDICFRTGFGNYSNFSRQFKRIKGLGPRELRQNFRGFNAADC